MLRHLTNPTGPFANRRFEPYNLKMDVSKFQSAIFRASFLDEVQHVTTSVAPSAGHCLGGFTTADATRQSHLTRK
jgi:hypothetical protein